MMLNVHCQIASPVISYIVALHVYIGLQAPCTKFVQE